MHSIRRILRFRILPLTMFCAVLLLGIKVGDLVRGGQELTHALLVSDVAAEQKADAKAEAKESAEKPAAKTDAKPETPAEDKKEDAAKTADAKSGAKDAAGAAATSEKDKKTDGKDAAPASSGPAAPNGAETVIPTQKKEYTQVELDILQSLSKRREEIEQWAKDVEVKENLLNATELRIDQKVSEIKQLKKSVEDLLVQYHQQEDAKIRSLVKIYENMKPKDAARIFDEMDMPILLLVVDRMSERKVAPVLAAMNPLKAKEVTTQLAEQRRIQAPVVGLAEQAQTGDSGASRQNAPAAAAPVAPAGGGNP